MCRQALVIGNIGLARFETAFKSAWASSNDDGVGIYWRDFNGKEGENKHLARFPKSENLGKVVHPYDRMLIHFRKATKGQGTHPFVCQDRPDPNNPSLNSGNWLLVHNGCAQDDKAREGLSPTHGFATTIDSEVFVHVWADIKETDLLKKIKAFDKAKEKVGITGWANLIFYNVVTDEWAALSDGSLSLVYSENILVICSDSKWLNMEEAKKNNVHGIEMLAGTVAFGKGTDYKIKKNGWEIHAYVAYSSPKAQGAGGIQESNMMLQASDWAAFYKKQKAKNERNISDYGTTLNHDFVASKSMFEDGKPLCDVCICTEAEHIENALAEAAIEIDAETSGTIQSSVWNRLHAFARDIKYTKEIRCMCGGTGSYGINHIVHEFRPIVKNGEATGYCMECGTQRSFGNHAEETAKGHWFTPLRRETDDGIVSTEVCGRCGYRREAHEFNEYKTGPKNYRIANSGTTRIMPGDDCGCITKGDGPKQICPRHSAQGFKYIDTNGMLVKVFNDKDND